MVTIWRLAAWLTSAVLFTGHIWYEHYRFNYSPRKTSLHTSSAAAVGAFGLALTANIHAQFVSSANQILLALSLVIWPILTAVPAFIVAFAITSVLKHYHKKVLPK
jgi:phosphate/sulfate permease